MAEVEGKAIPALYSKAVSRGYTEVRKDHVMTTLMPNAVTHSSTHEL